MTTLNKSIEWRIKFYLNMFCNSDNNEDRLFYATLLVGLLDYVMDDERNKTKDDVESCKTSWTAWTDLKSNTVEYC